MQYYINSCKRKIMSHNLYKNIYLILSQYCLFIYFIKPSSILYIINKYKTEDS